MGRRQPALWPPVVDGPGVGRIDSTSSRKSSSGSTDLKGDLKKWHLLHRAVREERDEGKGTSARLIPPREMVPSAQGNTGKEIRRAVHGARG